MAKKPTRYQNDDLPPSVRGKLPVAEEMGMEAEIPTFSVGMPPKPKSKPKTKPKTKTRAKTSKKTTSKSKKC